MRMGKPIIGITPGYSEEEKKLYVKNGYYEGVIAAGGLAVILPITDAAGILDELAEICDGLLVTGGPDLDAAHFGEQNMPYNGDISPERDQMELELIRKVFRLRKPIFGICRGIQVMNVALGGTLYQDIYSQLPNGNLLKHSQTAPKWYPTHEIRIEQGSKVWEIFRQEKLGVNTFHHQAVKDAAPGFRVTAAAPDGIIEAIEHENYPFAVGVQWHPELMWNRDERFLRLFEAFVDSCKLLI